MNLIDAWVTSINGKYYKHNKWWLSVGFEDIGGKGSTSLMFETEDECNLITIGYKFLH